MIEQVLQDLEQFSEDRDAFCARCRAYEPMIDLLTDAALANELQTAADACGDAPFRAYFSEVAAVPAPTESERANGFSLASEPELRRAFVAHLGLAVCMANRYLRAHPGALPFIDMVQAANDGLLRASKEYRAEEWSSFTACAVWWILRQMTETEAFVERMPRISPERIQSIRRALQFVNEYRLRTGKDPDASEIPWD